MIEFLARYRPRPTLVRSETDTQQSLEYLMRHFGARSLGKPMGEENEGIDADLQRIYSQELQETPNAD